MPSPPSRARTRTAGAAGSVAALAILATIAWFGMEPAVNALEWLEAHVGRYFWAALAAYLVLFSLLILTTLPVGTVFCLAGGYLFGITLGAGAALLAATTGATLTVLLVRGFGGRRLREWLSRGRLERWLKLLERDATWYLIILRVIPIMPFFPVNAAAGATRIGIGHFIAATAIGMTPTTIIYAAIGSGLNSVVDAREAAGPQIFLQPEVAVPLALLALLIAISWAIHHRLHEEQD
ncbi:MAG: TVP38/TMEM64 family protein [Wenzhouxiangella sp.]